MSQAPSQNEGDGKLTRKTKGDLRILDAAQMARAAVLSVMRDLMKDGHDVLAWVKEASAHTAWRVQPPAGGGARSDTQTSLAVLKQFPVAAFLGVMSYATTPSGALKQLMWRSLLHKGLALFGVQWLPTVYVLY
eukprot:gene8421-12979_t